MAFGWDDAITIGSGLLGAAGGLFGGGGSGGGNSWQQMNQTVSQQPWGPMVPFLTGGNVPGVGEVPGIFPEAGRLYNTTGWTPEMQTQVSNWFNDTANNRNIFQGSGAQNVGSAILGGQYDFAHEWAPQIQGAPEVVADKTNLDRARAGQGELDPTAALKGFLGGDSVNPFVDKTSQGITDLLTRNFKEQILPGIRHDAIADGQYGGSRGDIANTLAVSRLTQDLAPTLANLGLQAWESGEGRKYGTAMDLNRQASEAETGDANRKLQAEVVNAGNLLDAQKFNVGTTLNNNAQAMQGAAQLVNMRGAGLDFLGQAQGLTDQYYGDLLKQLNLPADYDWSNLGRYAGIVEPAAELFKTTNTTGSSFGGGNAGQILV